MVGSLIGSPVPEDDCRMGRLPGRSIARGSRSIHLPLLGGCSNSGQYLCSSRGERHTMLDRAARPVPGIPYGQQLVSAISRTAVVLFVFSAKANDSRAVLGELELASNRGKIILPVQLTTSRLRQAWISTFARSTGSMLQLALFDDVAPDLVRHVQVLLGQTAVVPSTPADVPQDPYPVHAPRHNLSSLRSHRLSGARPRSRK